MEDDDEDDDRDGLEPLAWVFMIGGTFLWGVAIVGLAIAAYRHWA